MRRVVLVIVGLLVMVFPMLGAFVSFFAPSVGII